MLSRKLLLLCLLLGAHAFAGDPLIRWDFGTEETSKLVSVGGVERDLPGPRPPEFPDFDADNLAVKFEGNGAHYVFATPEKASPYTFTNGDAITLECWVNMADIAKGTNVYLIGKGRTGDPAFPKDNQNWALRMREGGGQAHISFLFATAPEAGEAKDAHWHRWTTTGGFPAGSGWHHVAVAYKFGEPESARGYIDGMPTGGEWDMGGPSKAAPAVDTDAIWIASAMGGSPNNSFRGMLDSIAIYREALPADVLKTRFHREGDKMLTTEPAPPSKPAVPLVPPPGKVLVALHEAHGEAAKWTGEPGPETVRYTTDDFLFPRLPLHYDDWGIRAGWKGPVLFRAAAETKLAPGKQKFLLRARGLGRLWINGQVVATTKPPSGNTGGYQPVKPIPEPPLPGHHPLLFGDDEALAEVEIGPDGKCSVLLEVILGTKKARPEPGELCVAVLGGSTLRSTVNSGGGATYLILSPAQHTRFTLREETWPQTLRQQELALTQTDDTTRRTAAASLDGFWKMRHEKARAWVTANPAPAAPKGAANPIDAFLADRIEKALAASAGGLTPEGQHFFDNVLPVLRENCFRCHGEKEKGDLKLNSRADALKPGTSGEKAVVPGEPDHSELIARIQSTDPEERMPPKGDGLTAPQIAAVKQWIKSGAPWPAAPVAAADVAKPPVLSDAAFLRRVYLDTVGVPPRETEARSFLASTAPDKRVQLVNQLLDDERLGDHWISYWQDVLAENPSMLKPSLNNSGPFRFYLREAFRDRKPFDRVITELIMLRGSEAEGGSAGFGMAADNDAPLAHKGQVIGSAFLGVELQCARCHDSPFHSTKQRDLYALSAMLTRKAVTVPKTSTVPAAFFEKKARESLIKVTLKPGEPVEPAWPFTKLTGIDDGPELAALMQKPGDSREKLAAFLTAPQNRRTAQVIVNRLWKRLLGAGIVEPADDWEGHAPSHPELLAWLGHELVAHDYDLRHILRLILTSELYQREPTGGNLKAAPENRFFPAPDRRRLTAEEVVDSLFASSGKTIDVEELTFDPDSRQAANTMISLGQPSRAWQFASLSNERDRPSLALPRAQAVTDVLEAFGWIGGRQNPRSVRETDPNVLQPGVLANSLLVSWITRVNASSDLAEMALAAPTPETLVDSIFYRFLARPPSAEERARFVQAITPGFATRRVAGPANTTAPLPPLGRISWSNHLMAEANEAKIEMEKRARAGDPPDARLSPAWRETYEDLLWAVINTPEFVWMP